MNREIISKNLKIFRDKLGLNQRQFAEPLGITGGYVSKVEKGLSTLSDAVLCLIEINYRINREWLLKDEGEPFVKEWVEDRNSLFSDKGGPIIDSIKDNTERLLKERVEKRKNDSTEAICNVDKSNQPAASDPIKIPADTLTHLLDKTRLVLESKTGYANSLAANIDSFYDAIQTRIELFELKKEVKELRQIVDKLSTNGREKEDKPAKAAGC